MREGGREGGTQIKGGAKQDWRRGRERDIKF